MEGVGPSRVPGQHLQRAIHGPVVEAPRPVHALPQPGDDHVPGDLAQVSLVRIRHEEADRVRPHVHGGNPAGRRPRVDRLDPLRHPGPDGVVPAGQVIGVVRVEALQPGAGPAHAAPALRAGDDSPPLRRVVPVRGLEALPEVRVGPRPFAEPLDPPRRLHPGDRLLRLPAGQPEERRERLPIPADGVIADDERVAPDTPGHDLEVGDGLPAELIDHPGAIG